MTRCGLRQITLATCHSNLGPSASVLAPLLRAYKRRFGRLTRSVDPLTRNIHLDTAASANSTSGRRFAREIASPVVEQNRTELLTVIAPVAVSVLVIKTYSSNTNHTLIS